jgi:hypothetical protein
MAQSLVSMAMQYFSPAIVDGMAAAFGESADATAKGVAAGIPALLAGYAGFAAEPGGADRLAAAARQQDAGILDNLPTVIAAEGQQGVSDKGQTMLSLIFGSRASDGVIGAIGSFSHLSPGSAASLTGFLAPVVMAILGRHQARERLEAAALGRVLAHQQNAIVAAIPAEIRADVAAALGEAAAKPQPRSAATYSWAYALAALVLLSLLGYSFWDRQPREVARQDVAPAIASSAPPAPSIRASVIVGQADLSKQLSDILDSAGQSLGSVKDGATARNALPQLQDAVAQLDKLRRLSDQVPTDGRKTLTNIVRNANPGLKQSIEKVEAIRAAELLKPTLDSLQVRLDVLASGTGLPQTAQVPGASR